MKRHEALHPLSRDHHNVLVHARRLRGQDARYDAATARRRFLSYAPVLLLHFDEEEQTLAPHVDPGIRRRLLEEHGDLRQRIAVLGTASGEEQTAFGEALRQHVRFEEDVLYPHLEGSLAEEQMQRVATEGTAYRGLHRPESIDGSETCFL